VKILALDLATQLGWAVGTPADGPEWGTHRLPKTGEDIGKFLAVYDKWLIRMLDWYAPDLVVVEKPINMTNARSTIWVRLKLNGLVSHTEFRCHTSGFECAWADNWDWKRHFVGYTFGKKTKPYPVFQACKYRGWKAVTTDEADALGIWDYSICNLIPEKAHESTPLFAGAT